MMARPRTQERVKGRTASEDGEPAATPMPPERRIEILIPPRNLLVEPERERRASHRKTFVLTNFVQAGQLHP